jgi:hypothetical protein
MHSSGKHAQNAFSNRMHGLGTSLGGYHETRRCSRDTYPESYIIKYTSMRTLIREQVFFVTFDLVVVIVVAAFSNGLPRAVMFVYIFRRTIVVSG